MYNYFTFKEKTGCCGMGKGCVSSVREGEPEVLLQQLPNTAEQGTA